MKPIQAKGSERRSDERRGEKLEDILFEIGTEELPATNLADIFETPGVNPFEARLRKVLEENRIVFDSCAVWATPRRLIFRVRRAAPLQAPKDTLTRLMARQEAYDAAGAPTEKFLNILKHRRTSAKDTVIADHGGREFVFLEKKEPARQTRAVLPEVCEALVRTLAFPTTMRWDSGGVPFPRPIRNLLCLYGSRPVVFKLGRLVSGNRTLVFARSERKSFRVKDVGSYFALLNRQGIIADPAERKKAIRLQLEAGARHAAPGAVPLMDEFLLNEVNFLVENPRALTALFQPEFLKLPPEVLTVSMARQQRIFGMVDSQGRLLPRFIGVTDGLVNRTDRRRVSKHYENILQAKLQDSLFFYREDVKVPLEKKRDDLKGLIFLKGAGSMLDKSGRLARLARAAGQQAGLSPDEAQDLERAAFLSKADLVTHMVGEFPELQGVMGKYYALAAGERPGVAEAIGDQYLPRIVTDRLPAGRVASLLAVLDKADLIAACFALGLEPTSSLDPYGLRRSAAAIFKILIERKLKVLLPELIRQTLEELARHTPSAAAAGVPAKLEAFLKDRYRAVLQERGYRGDLVQAAMARTLDNPYETYERVRALTQLLSDAHFSQSCKVIERTVNILKGNRDPLPEEPDPAVFTEELERSVYKQYQQSKRSIRDAAAGGDFRRATTLYAGAFFDILGEFFEKVFVNDSDSNVRKNRLSLLKAVKDLYTEGIADLSKIDPELKTPIQKGNS